jgi:hypothetical protein
MIPFIPIRFAIGIHSTNKFQSTSFLKFEFHEKVSPSLGEEGDKLRKFDFVEVNKKGVVKERV